MSLVGPRPPLAGEVALYEDWQHDRLEVRPGITGLWQVSGRSELSFEDYVRLDLFYVENWSIAYDLFILSKTSRSWSRPGARTEGRRHARPPRLCSSGGHLIQLHNLKPWWERHDRLWVTFEKLDSTSLLAGERVAWAYHPTTRNLANLFRNTRLA